jgi:hypothetical protein
MLKNDKPAPHHVVEAIRTILGIKAHTREQRTAERRVARQQLRAWLSSIGAASPGNVKPYYEKQFQGTNIPPTVPDE